MATPEQEQSWRGQIEELEARKHEILLGGAVSVTFGDQSVNYASPRQIDRAIAQLRRRLIASRMARGKTSPLDSVLQQ